MFQDDGIIKLFGDTLDWLAFSQFDTKLGFRKLNMEHDIALNLLWARDPNFILLSTGKYISRKSSFINHFNLIKHQNG